MTSQTNPRIFLSSPHMSDEGYEQAYVQEAFDTNWIAPLGKNVNEFENGSGTIKVDAQKTGRFLENKACSGFTNAMIEIVASLTGFHTVH